MGEKISDFELKFQSSTQRQDGDNLVVDVNWATESDHEIYGAAFCTTTFTHNINDPDAEDSLKLDVLSWMFDNRHKVNNPKRRDDVFHAQVHGFLILIGAK